MKIEQIMKKLTTIKDTVFSKVSEKVSGNLSEKFTGIDFQQILRSKFFIVSCASVVTIMAVWGVTIKYQDNALMKELAEMQQIKSYEVSVDGKVLGFVSDKQAIERYVNSRLSQIMNDWDLEVKLANDLTYREVYDDNINIRNDQVLQAVQGLLNYETRSVMLYVNNEPVVRVGTEFEAERVIENVKNTYLSGMEDAVVMVAEINDRVDYHAVWGNPDEVKDIESATQILLRGTDEEIKHVVASGENIWVIAQKNKVTVSEIMQANPQIKSEKQVIHPGDEISLVVPKPYVNVEVVEQLTLTESIPFSTRYVNDNNMYTWESRVQSRGIAGEREVVYEVSLINGIEDSRTVLESTITREPVEQVVARGTIGVPTVGTGQFAWPTDGGSISSLFGGARRHSGLDISNPTGTPVYAADNGIVLFTGWQGAYGNLIRVAHSESLQTYYAHLSKISTSVGQNVTKGQLIGYIGSTGQSTGPHIHFEVRLNNTPTNPMNYFPNSSR